MALPDDLDRRALILSVLDRLRAAVRTSRAWATQYKIDNRVAGYRFEVPLGIEGLPATIMASFVDSEAWQGLELPMASGLQTYHSIYINFGRPRTGRTGKLAPIKTRITDALKPHSTGYDSETIVHEVTHFIDLHEGRIKRGPKHGTVRMGTDRYFSLGWENEARFQEAMHSLAGYVRKALLYRATRVRPAERPHVSTTPPSDFNARATQEDVGARALVSLLDFLDNPRLLVTTFLGGIEAATLTVLRPNSRRRKRMYSRLLHRLTRVCPHVVRAELEALRSREGRTAIKEYLRDLADREIVDERHARVRELIEESSVYLNYRAPAYTNLGLR